MRMIGAARNQVAHAAIGCGLHPGDARVLEAEDDARVDRPPRQLEGAEVYTGVRCGASIRTAQAVEQISPYTSRFIKGVTLRRTDFLDDRERNQLVNHS